MGVNLVVVIVLVRLCKVVSLVNAYYRQPSWSGLVPCAKGIGQLVLSCFHFGGIRPDVFQALNDLTCQDRCNQICNDVLRNLY